MSRTSYMLGDATKDMLLLEVGPSYNPLVTKADGWNVRIVDHATKAEPELKYRDWGVDVSRIEDVDDIWTGGLLEAAIPRFLHGKFDRVLASHVIEHMPDLLSFLNSVSALLSDSGTLALAVPDKRYTFDYFRPATLTSDIVTANALGAIRHSSKSAFETYFYNANAAGSIAWFAQPPGALALHHPWPVSVDSFNNFCNAPANAYIDMHASCFTPCSFELVILELAALGLCDLTVRTIYQTGAYEFYVLLDRQGVPMTEADPGEITRRRQKLLRGMLDETHEQVELLRQAEAAALAAAG